MVSGENDKKSDWQSLHELVGSVAGADSQHPSQDFSNYVPPDDSEVTTEVELPDTDLEHSDDLLRPFNKNYRSNLSRGEKVARLLQELVQATKADYKRRDESLEEAGLLGRITVARAVSMILGKEYLTGGGINYNKLADRVPTGTDISKLPEIASFHKKYGSIDPTHGPFGKNHATSRRKGAGSPRQLPDISVEPITVSITCNSAVSLEELLNTQRLNVLRNQNGTVDAQITGPDVGDYLRTLESKGYLVNATPK